MSFTRTLCAYLITSLLIVSTTSAASKPKIIGLMPVRNEEAIIEQALRALAVYTDAIVVLNDASTDSTGAIVEKLAPICHVEKIITKEVWQRDEKGDKNALLQAGRALGGTHFIFIDADELFSAECARGNNWLRRQILALKPGQAMSFPMMNVWDGVTQYRDDALCNPRHWRWRIGAAWCDDGICSYDANPAGGVSKQLHVYRIPCNRRGNLPVVTIVDLKYGLIHFKHANLENITIKKVWYMCLEFINANKKQPANQQQNAENVNHFYQAEFALQADNAHYVLKPLPPAWLDYSFFNIACFTKQLTTKQEEILAWFKEYGPDYFAPLAIWHINWVQALKGRCFSL